MQLLVSEGLKSCQYPRQMGADSEFHAETLNFRKFLPITYQ